MDASGNVAGAAAVAPPFGPRVFGDWPLKTFTLIECQRMSLTFEKRAPARKKETTAGRLLFFLFRALLGHSRKKAVFVVLVLRVCWRRIEVGRAGK